MPDLEDFTPLTVTPPSPEAVRRHGNDLRRRRIVTRGSIAAVVVAAAVIAVVAVPALRGYHPPRPLPVPAVSTKGAAPVGGWRTTIPDDFPLDDGMVGVPATGPPPSPTLDEVSCGNRAQAAPVAGMTAHPEPAADEPDETRGLALYRNADEARSIVTGKAAAVKACTSGPAGVHPLTVATAGESAFALVDAGDDQSTVVLYVQVGNAVLSDQKIWTETPSTGPDLLELSASRADGLREQSQRVVGAMCTFSVAGCPDSFVPPATAKAADEAAWAVYDPDYFRRIPLSGGLTGDDFGVAPLTPPPCNHSRSTAGLPGCAAR